MKYLGIDYGAKRVGIAVSDEAGTIAFPRDTLANDSSLIERLARLVVDEKVTTIVVGDTRAFSGFENSVTKAAESFIVRLAEKTGIPVLPAFEAGSSIEASRYSEDDSVHDDSSAAAIILQRYIEMKANSVG
jgi:putative Holliday junction resolvase